MLTSGGGFRCDIESRSLLLLRATTPMCLKCMSPERHVGLSDSQTSLRMRASRCTQCCSECNAHTTNVTAITDTRVGPPMQKVSFALCGMHRCHECQHETIPANRHVSQKRSSNVGT